MLGMALTTHPHPLLWLDKQYSYTTIPPLGLHGLLLGRLYLHLYPYLYHRVHFNEPFIFKGVHMQQHIYKLHTRYCWSAMLTCIWQPATAMVFQHKHAVQAEPY